LVKKFPTELAKHEKICTQPLACLQETWDKMDELFFNHCKQIAGPAFTNAGSTCTVCLLINNDLYITNCGDSSCYFVSKNGTSMLLTEEHGTHIADEANRVVENGGTLVSQKIRGSQSFPFCCFIKIMEGKPRVQPGGLLGRFVFFKTDHCSSL